MKKNILVTGAAGYIGSHTAKHLLENGYDVVSVDNYSLGNYEAKNELQKIAQEQNASFKAYECDISDREKMGKVFIENKIDAVVHFAAFSQVNESVIDPYKYYINNTSKTAILLDIMKRFNIDKIVFSSTAAVYGEPETIPILENSKQNPINPYGKSKLMIENIMDDASAYGLKSIRLRYFNVAGASSDIRLGEEHKVETHLIPNILYSALSQKNGKTSKTFKIFGNDYNTPDGTCIRDYIHVEDLAVAHELALKKLFEGGKTAYYNLGSSSGYSVKEVFDEAKLVTKMDIKVEIAGRREGDPATLIASNKKALEELGFEPKKTLKDMIETTWNWIQNDKWKKH